MHSFLRQCYPRTTAASSYLRIFGGNALGACLHSYLKGVFSGPGSWLCVNTAGQGLFDVVMPGRLPTLVAQICQAALMSERIVLAALLIVLSTDEGEWEKIKTPSGHG